MPTVMDVFTREARGVDLGVRLRADDVVVTVKRRVVRHGAPRDFFVDIRHVETFNGSLRDEYRNGYWFKTLTDAKRVLAGWRAGGLAGWLAPELQREPYSQLSQCDDAIGIRRDHALCPRFRART